ncbi:MAG: hypothetical protein BMS9Abin36_1750 [Gammaproteobacteria bacterium]|nr:MAG: hypothetical protein BMS9Abin36_1750 [Gammaproteobacteria bacterium]
MGNAKKQHKTAAASRHAPYPGFRKINGSHPLRQAVPDGFVNYAARRKPGGEVFFFNFALAKEMGLIPASHPDTLNSKLCQVILDTFSLQIINEYDLGHKTRIPKKDILANEYMATRYLQLQHANKKGLSSGDGRSIWNGCFTGLRAGKKTSWDISSCGTGATRLSPATSYEGRFIKTGDPAVSYGCGRADLTEGVGAAINSEIFHHNNIPTERILAIIAYRDNSSINVRASRNLLRPAHFFPHVKQNNYQGLKGAVDYYIDRQTGNGDWPKIPKNADRYQTFLERVATCFGKTAAIFEMEYIFCWMDWDGDNILTDGGIVDFGSVRQFGLFHSEYRYDDVDRYSTTITEQKNKARYIVQTFAQIADFLATGSRKPIRNFRQDSALKIFSQTYERTRVELIVYKMGFDQKQIRSLMNDSRNSAVIRSFRSLCRYFENAKSGKGLHSVGDGITRDAIFCLRDILRELPGLYITNGAASISPETFINIIKSNYAGKKDLVLTSGRREKIRQFQTVYINLVDRVARLTGADRQMIFKKIASRSSLINRYDRATGDALIYVTDKLIKNKRKFTTTELSRIIQSFVEKQILRPEYFEQGSAPKSKMNDTKSKKLMGAMLKVVETYREGI